VKKVTLDQAELQALTVYLARVVFRVEMVIQVHQAAKVNLVK